jgi:glyoxylase-like metal-dependent hydrolase (beta-lactamase superfamily II)
VIDFVSDAPVSGDLNVRWIHGSPNRRTNTDPPMQVHAYDPHTYILRQNKAVNYEAPFLYLLFGNERALLWDTGATAEPDLFPLRATIDGMVDEWLKFHPQDNYDLIVAHSHGHGDHVAADAQFSDRPHTVLVEADLDRIKSFYGFTAWPYQVVQLDLGGRVLDITGIPGHDTRSLAVFDPWSGFLLTGDTVYPGRLYAREPGPFAMSMEHLAEFADARPVTHVMGCHIEQSRTPRRDYPIGCTYQPKEAPLQMTMEQLHAVRDATRAVRDRPGIHVFDDFTIYNGSGPNAGMAPRVLLARARNAVSPP